MCDDEYASFLVRWWSKTTADESANWQGEIEHIQTGHTLTLQSPEELLAVLNEWPKGPGRSIENIDI